MEGAMAQSKPAQGAAVGEGLEQRLQAMMHEEAAQLADWSAQQKQPPTLGDLEQTVLAALRRLGPQLLEALLDKEAASASFSPPVLMREGHEGHRAAAQTPADAAGRDQT
jgi:hypothetical protein